MIRQTPGKIFLSEQRGIIETTRLMSFCTFNFGKYFNEHKERFGDLYLMNEESLKGEEGVIQEIMEDSYVIIIPIIGEVLVQAGHESATMVDVEEVSIQYIPKGISLNIINPYEFEEITFLQLRVKAHLNFTLAKSHLFRYTFDEIKNNVANITASEADVFSGLPFKISLGRFDGRKEDVYRSRDRNSLVFAHVLSGVFELEGRLMHEKDCLALWETEEIELEALSNHALVFIIEMYQD
jgi:hypothetical protein